MRFCVKDRKLMGRGNANDLPNSKEGRTGVPDDLFSFPPGIAPSHDRGDVRAGLSSLPMAHRPLS